jgi:hypothetical protein
LVVKKPRPHERARLIKNVRMTLPVAIEQYTSHLRRARTLMQCASWRRGNHLERLSNRS